ncbi:23S rRNA (adenine(2503)-C(2))-methyltransferase RlmN [Pseudomaricurvus alkylphenolicus]|jgi:23S rRNA (adenine2503-C2)-methyltransferase|uniref:23S rRNA (adenine(2503)-C(2))-methyltransferase RlmN n=1 Tax=Pseudomaricurvus alkylphenolicus TaxID=1306991 RepID=UPI0014228547|nr:23S rRNA (adenine(2503)-C(2))-methyltransferase RlmN [Pseudomaricurvus alkylphenolicus]NIB43953.1 23S rRNA (adenine(2503)-C(2))-methyltransferase RlmN [Pseudomaricurvus alkylphenolicus]
MTDTVSETVSDKKASTEANTEKVNLLGLSQAKLEAFFESIGEKKFRATQVLKWIHQMGVDNFDEMTNISKVLREKLKRIAEIRAPKVLQQLDSADGTRKFLIEVTGGSAIEAVLIPDGERGTLCVSSQVGCSLDCSFCSTGKQGFNRDLTAAEIIGQVWLAAKSYGQFGENRPRIITNVVMMGMGEPLLNFDNVVDAMNLMMHDNCYGISKRRVTLSTSGVVPQLDRLGEVTDVCLAVSLHAPNDELRNELVPINKKYPIAMLLDSAQRYIEGLPDNHRKITIEYTLINQLNDRPHHAHELAQLLRDIPVKINLIPFNPFDQSDYRRVSNNALKNFQDILIKAGFTTTIRTTRGDDIDAACGQLAGAVNDRTRRSERHRAAHSARMEAEPVRIVN